MNKKSKSKAAIIRVLRAEIQSWYNSYKVGKKLFDVEAIEAIVCLRSAIKIVRAAK